MTPTTAHHAHAHLHPHGHHEHHPHNAAPAPVISKIWKWASVIGNAAIGFCELVAGNMSTLAVAADGAHNLGGDAATFYLQAENILNPELTEQKRQQRRKLAHWLIAASSAGIGAKAGIDWAFDQQHTPHGAAIYTAGASLILSGVLVARLHRNISRRNTRDVSASERDLLKHFWKVDIPSASLGIVGAGLQKYSVDIEQVLAMLSGGIGAWAFRPTRANLADSCIGHDHSQLSTEHEGHHHATTTAHEHGRPARHVWQPQHRSTPRHVYRAAMPR